MVHHRSLQQLAHHLQTKSLTLTHALDQDLDPQLLMEISYEISLLSSQFRDQILEEAVGQLQEGPWGWSELPDHPSD